MKLRFLLVAVILSAAQSLCLAQNGKAQFYTLGMKNATHTISCGTTVCDSSGEQASEGYSALSVAQIERLIQEHERRLSVRDSLGKAKEKNANKGVLQYYEGDSHELNIDNLTSVVREVGLDAQLFVLAQALLETGNFHSHVCKVYHNLFGLYDSRRRDYYRFARWEDSVVAYQRMIQYRDKGGNYLDFLRRIGYAEDPSYTSKVAKIAVSLYKKMFSN